ncbi:MAG: hypothetical protein Q9165_008295 [Trypethelium subeluteriae]
MFWYLLYPLRGTTKPPVLSHDHPIRKAFFNYGTAAARRWLLALLIPVAIGVVLCYPALFLYYDNPATGSSNLPHHVWTSARLHTGSPITPPDIEMRQMWIYGSYMKVLDPQVIAKALKIQNFVLGLGSQRDTDGLEHEAFGRPELDYGELNASLVPANARAGALTWGYHSPLMYWNCTMSLIHGDRDSLSTINRQAHRRTFMNLTMRPTSVFAGKTFEKNNLTAADALVLTFFNVPNLGIGELWDQRMKELADYMPDLWSLFPATGMIIHSKLFRLMNAVLSYPLEMPIISRVANALGDVGHLSLAAVTMNLILLRVLSLVFSPDVASFCAFAAVALVIDFSFHLTFFLAVLSVDVKRMELKDSLDRANRSQSGPRASQVSNWQVWKYFLSSRPLPASTRIAGSAAIVGCVSILNWHFFDWESQKRAFKQVAGLIPPERSATTGHNHMSVPHSFGQTRTPAAWLRMQEYHTAKEVISVVKPDSHSFLARVYDPLMIVLAGADRTGAAAQKQNWLQRTEALIDDHLFAFLFVLIFSVAFVVILLRYLLYNDLPDEEDLEETEDSFLTIKDLPKSHGLDIIKLTACGRGQMASVGLDRLRLLIVTTDGYLTELDFQLHNHHTLLFREVDVFIWLAYTETETGNCYMHTFTAREGQNASICLQSSLQHDSLNCKGFAHAAEALHWVDSAGVWESCAAQAIIGIRKRPQITQATSEDSKERGYNNGTTNFLHTLRSRRRIVENAIGARRHDNDDWEAYTLSTSGDFYTTPLHPSSATVDEADPLFVSSAGPICKLGARSVAVGFGNGIKIVALGHERFEELGSGIDTGGAGYIGSVSRRGKQNKKQL